MTPESIDPRYRFVAVHVAVLPPHVGTSTNCAVPFAFVIDGKRKLTTVRPGSVMPRPVYAMTALAVPLVFNSGASPGMFTVPKQVPNAYSIVTLVRRRSGVTVKAIARPCDVVPAHVPLKSSGVGRGGGAQAHQIRIAMPAANCHSSRVNGRNPRIGV